MTLRALIKYVFVSFPIFHFNYTLSEFGTGLSVKRDVSVLNELQIEEKFQIRMLMLMIFILGSMRQTFNNGRVSELDLW